MRRFILFSGVLCIALGSVSGAANATVWFESVYDLTGSAQTTHIYDALLPPPSNPPFQTFGPNAVTGMFTVHWGAASVAGPITQGKFIDGISNTDMYMDAGIFVVTGVTNTVLLPSPASGEPGTVAGGTFSFSGGVVADSSATGYIHCTSGACAMGGFTLSVSRPLTPTGPGPFPASMPAWSFTGGVAGASGASWNGATFNSTVPASTSGDPFTVVVETSYMGQEISRTPVPEPGILALLLPGIAGLGALRRLRRRR